MRFVKVAACAGLVLAAFLTLVVWAPFGEERAVVIDNIAQILTPMAAAVFCYLAAKRQTGHARGAWLLFAASCVSWGTGSAIWAHHELILDHALPFPSFADAGYLGGTMLAIAGMLTLAPAPRPGERLRDALDGVVIAAALLFVSWALVLGPVARSGSGAPFAQTLAIAYPLGDVIVGTLALHVAARSGRGNSRVIWLLATGFVSMAMADSGFAYLTSIGAYSTGHFIDAGWITGYLLVALAAISTGPAIQADRGPVRVSPFETMLPYGPFVLAAFVGVHVWQGGEVFHPVLVWSAMALALGVVARQVVTTVENVDLVGRLAQANDDLRRTEAYRNQALHNIAHDLETTLAPIEHQVDALERGDVDAEARSAHALLRRNLQQLRRMSTDVRDAAALEVGGLRLEHRRVDLATLVTAAVDSFRGLAEARGIHVALKVPAMLPVRVDGGRLTQAIYNLLASALASTPQGGRVDVVVGMARGQARVIVRDSGDGFAAGAGDDLFLPFGDLGGAGLARYIARGIVEQHGGSLEATSEGPGKGAAFTLTLPLESFLLRDRPALATGSSEGASPS